MIWSLIIEIIKRIFEKFKMSPEISIIIPCYNHGQYLLETIKSVENSANSHNYEIILIDDGSTDEKTKLTINQLEKKNITIIKQRNQGLARARNNGINVSKGSYIITLDADDKLTSIYFEKGIRILKSNPKIGIIYGSSNYFGEENRHFKPGKFSQKKLLVNNYINSCIMFRKEVWNDVNGYDPNLTAYEDWDFNLSAAALGWKFYYIPEIVFEYRILKNSMIRSHKGLQDCSDYIAKKHGVLYRNEFLKNITIIDRIKSAIIDLFRKIIGRPSY